MSFVGKYVLMATASPSLRTRMLRIFAVASCLIACCSSSAKAGYIVSFEAPKSIAPGSPTTLDVFLRSDSTTLESLDAFSLSLQLSRDLAGSGSLHFAMTQSDDQWNDPVAYSNYVFNSLGNASGNLSFSATGTSVSLSDIYTSGDFRFDTQILQLVADTPQLIARVDLVSTFDFSGSFRIEVYNPFGETQFTPIDPSDVTQAAPNPGPFTVEGFGQISANSNVNTIPEPSSLTAFTLLCCTIGMVRFRRSASNGK